MMNSQSKYIILFILFFAIKRISLAQSNSSIFCLDNVLREIQNTSIHSLSDSDYYNKQRPYFKMFYDMLDADVRKKLMTDSKLLWARSGCVDNADSIKGERLDFYIKVAVYFQDFYAKELQSQYYEKWKNDIGDSLHIKLYVDSVPIPSCKFQTVFIFKDSSQTKTTCNSQSSTGSLYIADSILSRQVEIYIHFKNKYFAVDAGRLSQFRGTTLTCYFYSKSKIPFLKNSVGFKENDLINADGLIMTSLEPYFYTGYVGAMPIKDLHKSSKIIRKRIRSIMAPKIQAAD